MLSWTSNSKLKANNSCILIFCLERRKSVHFAFILAPSSCNFSMLLLIYWPDFSVSSIVLSSWHVKKFKLTLGKPYDKKNWLGRHQLDHLTLYENSFWFINYTLFFCLVLSLVQVSDFQRTSTKRNFKKNLMSDYIINNCLENCV